MNRLIALLAASAWLLVSGISATVINVPDEYPTIQLGLDASSDGDTVLVQPGTYVENVNFNGHNIVLGSLFLTTGDTAYVAQTIIDGRSAGAVLSFGAGLDENSVVTGFTIRNGSNDLGGGIYLEDCQPILCNNIIRDNESYNSRPYSGGGGIRCQHSDAVICHNIIISNNSSTLAGGGIYCFESSPAIIENNISRNTVPQEEDFGYGGAIFCWYSQPMIKNNIISENEACWGGGIFCNNSDAVIVHNTISANTAFP